MYEYPDLFDEIANEQERPESTTERTELLIVTGYRTTSAVAGNVVAGVDIGGTNLRLALADLGGSIVARSVMSTVGIRDPNVIVRLICDGIALLLVERALAKSALLAIAAGAPGVTDVDRGVVIATSYLMGWKDVPLRRLLEQGLGVPAIIDNDVNLAALGESRAGVARAADSFVFVALGTGIGAGIVLDGKLFRGKHWTAGEIGYMLVPGVKEDPVSGDMPGALEEIAGGQGIKAQWQRLWDPARTDLPRGAIASAIFNEASAGDPLASLVLENTARTLAYAIYNIWLLLNCDLFVLGGSVGLHRAVGDSTRRFVAERCGPDQVRIAESVLGADAQLMGAIFMAIEHVTGPSSSR